MKAFAVVFAAAAVAACSQHQEPGQAGSAAANPQIAIANGDFEKTAADGSIPGWVQVQHAGERAFDMRIDGEGAYRGHGSFHITRTQQQIFGSLTQNLDLSAYAGKTLELSAMMKSREVGKKGWKLLINANVVDTLRYSPALVGTNDWQRQSVSLKLPAEGARHVTIGATLLDGGEGCMDEVQLKVVD